MLVERADRFLAERPGAEDAIRRILTLKLATVREDGEPTRRREFRAEFSDEEWRLVSELSGYPNRLLVTATTEAGETYAEVAHEAIFRRWGKLKEWIAAEREFLAWRSGLEAARRAWEKTPDKDKNDALLMGFALKQAQSWLAERKAEIPKADQDFIVRSGSESIAAEREFRSWRSACERARDAWEKKAHRDKNAALLTGSALTGLKTGSPSVPTTLRKPTGRSLPRAARRRGGASSGRRRSSASWSRRWPWARRPGGTRIG